MTHRPLYSLAVTALLASSAEGVTRCVRPSAYPGCFTSIQAAVDASTGGDLINVASGVYFENVDIPAGKDGLQVVGAGKLKTIIDPDDPLTGDAFSVASSSVTIKNLGIRNGQGNGVSLNGVSGVVIQGLRIVGLRGPLSTGIFGLGNDGLQVLNNEIRAVRNGGIDIGGENLVVTGNTVTQAPVAINLSDSSGRVAFNKVIGVRNGIQVDDVSGGLVVSNNTIELSIDDGVSVLAQNPTVQANKLINAGEIQITCSPLCSGGVASANTSLGSLDFGFSIRGEGPGFVARGNKVSWSNGPGFLLSGIEATANTATDAGIFGHHDGPDCFRVRGLDPTALTGNTASRCAGSGFRVVESNNATLRNNTASQAGVDGFTVSDVLSVNNTLTGNKSLFSNAAGFAVIDAVGTTLDGNIGSKNRYGFCDDGTSTALGQNNFGIPPTSNVCDVVQ
jgi:parallel beta-helix repeat protein